jgi:cephalosporin hydroxylase
MHKVWDESFENWRKGFLKSQSEDQNFSQLSRVWLQKSVNHKYSYQFDWLGVPIIQMPGDLIVFQDIVYKTRPDLIIETGIARGGSLIFWASIQQLCGIEGRVLGIDIDIRDHAIQAIKNSRFNESIELIRGSSTGEDVISKVVGIASNFERVMVVLDSNHTHDHVMKELKLYSELVSPGCMLLVLDTAIDDLEVDPDRNWGPGASPKSAVLDFMATHEGEFVNHIEYETRAAISVAPQGYWLKK